MTYSDHKRKVWKRFDPALGVEEIVIKKTAVCTAVFLYGGEKRAYLLNFNVLVR